ncbi:MAG: cob(I)yrinic acid a,c-diamide adenosyltransferase [Propionibacteriaceae bacterium]|nr:cob(I)yrinic acid a,c-diamide adenosyltransferase [Propionibacteriaceae bacterium]
MVNLTRIYTRTGDNGTTRLSNNQEVSKSDLLLEAYGTVDEANSLVGLALSDGDMGEKMGSVLRTIQNDLFDVGADLSTPLGHEPALRVKAKWIDQLEQWCDEFGEELPPLKSFVLPGGTSLAGLLNCARTVVRRAEREGWRAHSLEPVNEVALTYLNRLSDLLFILARYANLQASHEESLWVPGATMDDV